MARYQQVAVISPLIRGIAGTGVWAFRGESAGIAFDHQVGDHHARVQQMPLIPDQGPVEQLAAAGQHPALHDRVRSRHLDPAEHDRDRNLSNVWTFIIGRPYQFPD
jgi:hypothetical protein